MLEISRNYQWQGLVKTLCTLTPRPVPLQHCSCLNRYLSRNVTASAVFYFIFIFNYFILIDFLYLIFMYLLYFIHLCKRSYVTPTVVFCLQIFYLLEFTPFV